MAFPLANSPVPPLPVPAFTSEELGAKAPSATTT